MPKGTRYLFDTDVLIASARIHYHPNYCQAFWDWVIDGHNAGLFFSIDKVKSEFLAGKRDPMLGWVTSGALTNFFQPSLQSLPVWHRLSTLASDPAKGYKTAAKNKFLDADKADAWLISHAAHHGNFKIVTNEVSEPNSKREIKLPDAADWLSITTIKLHDLLQLHAGHNFAFK